MFHRIYLIWKEKPVNLVMNVLDCVIKQKINIIKIMKDIAIRINDIIEGGGVHPHEYYSNDAKDKLAAACGQYLRDNFNEIIDGLDFSDKDDVSDNPAKEPYQIDENNPVLTAETLQLIKFWRYNYRCDPVDPVKDEALSLEGFIEHFGYEGNGHHYYDKWLHTYKQSFWEMLCYLGGKERGDIFLKWVIRQTNKYLARTGQRPRD